MSLHRAPPRATNDRKLPPDGSAVRLISFTGVRQSVAPSKILKGRRNSERRQGPLTVTLGVLDYDIPFQHRLRQFLDKRIPVGLSDDLCHHFGWQRAARSAA